MKTLLRMVSDRGYDFSGILQHAGLDFDPLDEDCPDYRTEVSAMQYSRVYQQVLSLLQDETFGVTGSDLVAPGAFRMMCYCVISCENLGQAIQRASEFYRTFFDERSQLYANFSQEFARVGYQTTIRTGQPQVGPAHAYGLSMWHRFFGWLCGRPIELQRVDFAGDPPANPDKYEALFGCPLYFNQAKDLLYFDSACLAWPVVHTQHSLREFLHTAPYQMLLLDNDTSGNNLSVQVRAMIGHDFSEGFPSFEMISSALHMSAPTLRRRLKREGTTFQEIKDQARCEAAKLCLNRHELSINEVALQMGFTDPSAFHRSFKKWTGETPGQFRQGLRSGR
ncbi:helix-turn-helix domain-containing protein [Seongchinamella sediminis]|uniref:Helix-turn-helix domain-containing protein n=1 Tax=Seongchinamella sediminis TaxID=2283635 RepID=A0A3L7DVJ6_9GAMM|nr:helix-turn-helix domain-containing protein [Seongchinamella sediminis]